ncbi:MAG: alpha/beta hydrolase fold domain-containing protein [Croceibacterium sp.]
MAGTTSLCAIPSQAQQYEAPLYSGPAPGSENWNLPVVTRDRDGGISRYNTSEPRVEVFLPEAQNASGTAVIMLPGGALRVLGMGGDTSETIRRFNAEGVAVILLEYRTLQIPVEEIDRPAAPRATGAPPRAMPKLIIQNANANPSPGDKALDEVLRLATADGQAALKLARAHASDWHIDPQRVGMIGTSAGGGVAFGAMMAGAEGATPDFVVSIFGPSLQDVAVPVRAPPLFLVTESNHGPVTDGLVALFEMWKDNGKPAELHAYEVKNFSMCVSLWGDRLFDWMREQNLLPSSAGK